jgi:hypothetical protein
LLGQILPDQAVAAAERERALLGKVLDFAEGFDPSDAQQIRELIGHLEDMFLLVVVGEVKAGKSAFINALLDHDACPEGPLPLTDRVFVLAYGDAPAEHAAEPHVVRRELPIDYLRRMSVVDTPGTNSPLKRHQLITESFLPRADIVFFVTSIDCPLTQTDIRFLGKIRERWKKEIACVLAKVDMRPEQDRALVTDYLKSSFRDLLGFTPPVFAVSSHLARQARRDGDEALREASGLPAVERYIVENLSESRRVLLKLKSPLGAVFDVLRRAEATGDRRLRALEQDFAGWKAVEEQAGSRGLAQGARGAPDLAGRARRSRASRRAGARSCATGSGCATCGSSATREVPRGVRARRRARHRRGDRGQGRGRRVARGRRRAGSGRSTTSADRRASRYREEIPAGGSLAFRRRGRARSTGSSQRAARPRGWSARASAGVRDLASKSLTRLLGIEAAAMGLGAAAVTALGASLAGLVGVAVAAGVALRGFFVLPARREQAVVRFEEGVRATRDALLAASVRGRADRAAAVLDAFAPFHDFYQSAAGRQALGRRRRVEGRGGEVQEGLRMKKVRGRKAGRRSLLSGGLDRVAGAWARAEGYAVVA